MPDATGRLRARHRRTSLAQQGMEIVAAETIDQGNFSEPAGINLDHKKDAHNYLHNIIHSFLSKEGVFTNFAEGREALSRTPDGYKVLNILLSQTHPKMLDMRACGKQKPKYWRNSPKDTQAEC